MNYLHPTEVSNNLTHNFSQYQIHRKCTVAIKDIKLAKSK